jgi:hypothetical protein
LEQVQHDTAQLLAHGLNPPPAPSLQAAPAPAQTPDANPQADHGTGP